MRGVKIVASWIAGLGLLAGVAYDSVSLHLRQNILEAMHSSDVAGLVADLADTKKKMLDSQAELERVRTESVSQEKKLLEMLSQQESVCSGAHQAIINEIVRDRSLNDAQFSATTARSNDFAQNLSEKLVGQANTVAGLEKRISKTAQHALGCERALGLAPDPLMERLRDQCVFIKNNGYAGSGTIISCQAIPEGYRYLVLTAYHVLEGSMRVNEGSGKLEFALPVTVRGVDNRVYSCAVVLGKSSVDLALLSFDARAKYPVARLASRGKLLQPDELVYSVGHPLACPEPRVTQGKVSVSTTDREGIQYVQNTAFTIQGCSGGAVYNAKGKLIGVNHGVRTNSLVIGETPFSFLFNDVSVALPQMPIAIGAEEVHKALEPGFADVCCSVEQERYRRHAVHVAARFLGGMLPQGVVARVLEVCSQER